MTRVRWLPDTIAECQQANPPPQSRTRVHRDRVVAAARRRDAHGRAMASNRHRGEPRTVDRARPSRTAIDGPTYRTDPSDSVRGISENWLLFPANRKGTHCGKGHFAEHVSAAAS